MKKVFGFYEISVSKQDIYSCFRNASFALIKQIREIMLLHKKFMKLTIYGVWDNITLVITLDCLSISLRFYVPSIKD